MERTWWKDFLHHNKVVHLRIYNTSYMSKFSKPHKGEEQRKLLFREWTSDFKILNCFLFLVLLYFFFALRVLFFHNSVVLNHPVCNCLYLHMHPVGAGILPYMGYNL